jgi:hypothetical protein
LSAYATKIGRSLDPARIRKIAPELRRPKRNAKSERAPRLPGNGIERYYGAKLYAVSSRIFKQHRNILDCVAERDPGGAANGGDDEERAAAMKANPNAKKTKPGKGGGALYPAPQGKPQFTLPWDDECV